LQLAQSSEQRSAGPLVQQAQRWSTRPFFAYTFFSFTVVIVVIFQLFVIFLNLDKFLHHVFFDVAWDWCR
jgi:hypothetical protein